jgi:hypothetical protein
MLPVNSVFIQGEGVAAACCAHLLSRAAIAVSGQQTGRARLPAIMLSDSAVELIRDVFGDPGLLRELPRITKRFVMWGGHDIPVVLEHSAIVASEVDLLSALAAPPSSIRSHEREAWTIFASKPLPDPVAEHRFGSRLASAVPIQLIPSAEPESCWIEAVDDGWLFLITNAPGTAWLLAVGGAADDLLGKSRLVGSLIDQSALPSASFPAAPRMVSPLFGTNWLTCGTAAMAFDPICGDGTAHAVREAILASAVIRAAISGGDPAALSRHYQARLTAGFRRHLELCLQYYQSGPSTDWWHREAEAIRSGIAWCDGTKIGPAEYRMIGFDLQRIA